MACHEIAALRLGLMQVLGVRDEAERAHEVAELGDALHKPGPLQSLAKATDMDSLARLYAAAVAQLGDAVAKTPDNDPKLPYLRTLIVLTKKVELELNAHIKGLSGMWHELEEMHDFVHEIYPAK